MKTSDDERPQICAALTISLSSDVISCSSCKGWLRMAAVGDDKKSNGKHESVSSAGNEAPGEDEGTDRTGGKAPGEYSSAVRVGVKADPPDENVKCAASRGFGNVDCAGENAFLGGESESLPGENTNRVGNVNGLVGEASSAADDAERTGEHADRSGEESASCHVGNVE